MRPRKELDDSDDSNDLDYSPTIANAQRVITTSDQESYAVIDENLRVFKSVKNTPKKRKRDADTNDNDEISHESETFKKPKKSGKKRKPTNNDDAEENTVLSVPLTQDEKRKRIAELEGKESRTKAEEKELKQLRRKFKNAESAANSRLKLKDNLEELESKVELLKAVITQLKLDEAVLTVENKEIKNNNAFLESLVLKVGRSIQATNFFSPDQGQEPQPLSFTTEETPSEGVVVQDTQNVEASESLAPRPCSPAQSPLLASSIYNRGGFNVNDDQHNAEEISYFKVSTPTQGQ